MLRSALLLVFLAAATPSLHYFRYTRSVYTVPARSGQTCATLDPEVFAQSGAGLASLRLYQGQAIHPYVVVISGNAARNTGPRAGSNAAQYVTVAATPQVAEQGHDSVITFAIPPNVPVDRIRFSVGSSPAEFSRPVSICVRASSVQNKNASVATIAYGNLLRVHTMENGHEVNEEHLVISAPHSSTSFADGTRWTITVHNQNDPPLDIRSVSLQMIARNLCFDAAANAAYSLYYGDPALTPPRYDYTTLFVPEKNAARAALGPEQLNQLYTPRPDTRPFTEKHPTLLWVALIAAILILGAIALSSAKHLRQP